MTPNKEHRKVFGDNPYMIGWRKPKSLKDHSVITKIKSESSSDNKNAPCCRSRRQICSFIEETTTFQNKDKSETFDIRKGILNCSRNLVVYLIESVNHVLSSMWVVLLQRFVPVLIIIQVGLRKVSKVYHNKCNIYQNWSLLSLIGLKMI